MDDQFKGKQNAFHISKRQFSVFNNECYQSAQYQMHGKGHYFAQELEMCINYFEDEILYVYEVAIPGCEFMLNFNAGLKDHSAETKRNLRKLLRLSGIPSYKQYGDCDKRYDLSGKEIYFSLLQKSLSDLGLSTGKGRSDTGFWYSLDINLTDEAGSEAKLSDGQLFQLALLDAAKLEVTALLLASGIKGISAWHNTYSSQNYVIFDSADIQIVKTNKLYRNESTNETEASIVKLAGMLSS